MGYRLWKKRKYTKWHLRIVIPVCNVVVRRQEREQWTRTGVKIEATAWIYSGAFFNIHGRRGLRHILNTFKYVFICRWLLLQVYRIYKERKEKKCEHHKLKSFILPYLIVLFILFFFNYNVIIITNNKNHKRFIWNSVNFNLILIFLEFEFSLEKFGKLGWKFGKSLQQFCFVMSFGRGAMQHWAIIYICHLGVNQKTK